VVPALAVAALQVIIVPVDLAARLRVRRDLIARRQLLRLHAQPDITAPLAQSFSLLARLVTTVLRVALHLLVVQQVLSALRVLLFVRFVARVLTVTQPGLLVLLAQLEPIATQLAQALYQLV
jgi:hypothetical protein